MQLKSKCKNNKRVNNMKTKYETTDGQTFDDANVANKHEAELEARKLAEEKEAQEYEAKQKAEKVEAEKKAMANSISVMDNSSIAMITFPKSVMEEEGMKSLKKQLNVKSFSKKHAPNKEPEVDFGGISTYNLDYMIRYLKFMEKQGATHVEIAVKTNDPIRISAKTEVDLEDEEGNKISEKRNFRFWLAPYLSD